MLPGCARARVVAPCSAPGTPASAEPVAGAEGVALAEGSRQRAYAYAYGSDGVRVAMASVRARAVGGGGACAPLAAVVAAAFA